MTEASSAPEAPSAPEVPTAEGDAQIFGRGYRPYEGDRAGVGGAVWSTARHSFRAALGLGRPARHKILPVVAAVLSFLPAVALAGISALLGSTFDAAEDFLPAYHEYYGFIGVSLVLYCGLVVPDILVADRRNGLFGLYMSTPLQRWSYLAAKAQAVMMTLAIVTVGPVLVLLLAYTLYGAGPEGLGGWTLALGRILGAGLAYAALYAAVSLAVASLTDRRAIASVGVIGLIIGTSIVAPILVEGAEMSAQFNLLNLLVMPYNMVEVIFGAPVTTEGLTAFEVVRVCAGWTVAGCAAIWWRYRRLEAS